MTLLRLVRDFLRPYRGLIVGLVLLQLVGTMASLYLPSLNGQIIDEGVAMGDTGFILRTGVVMLAVSLVQIVATIGATYLGRPRRPRASAATCARRSSRGSGEFSAQEVSRFGAPTLISRSTNDVDPGADGHLHGLRDHGVGADHDGRRHHHGPARGRRPVLAGRRRGAAARRSSSAWSSRGWCRTSARCRSRSTGSTASCASRSPASAWCAPSSARTTSASASRRPTAPTPAPRSPSAG